MQRALIAGNWKMNGSLPANDALIAGVKEGMAGAGLDVDVAVCVPAPYLHHTRAALVGSTVALGAQDVSPHASGAYTGEVAGSMLVEFGCTYVIVGHSERRGYHGETSEAVAAKVKAALAAGLTPIVCVGETLAERETGQTEATVCRQLQTVLDAIAAADLVRLVVAYEPIWAIGTGKTATPQMAQDVHAVLRTVLVRKDAATGAAARILYGGSMKPDNARELLAMPDINGGLIGGAALKAADFLAIVRAAH